MNILIKQICQELFQLFLIMPKTRVYIIDYKEYLSFLQKLMNLCLHRLTIHLLTRKRYFTVHPHQVIIHLLDEDFDIVVFPHGKILDTVFEIVPLV